MVSNKPFFVQHIVCLLIDFQPPHLYGEIILSGVPQGGVVGDLRRSVIESSRRIRRAGITDIVLGEVDKLDNFLFWIRADGGIYWLYFLKPSSGENPKSVQLKRPPQPSGRPGRATYVLTVDRWRLIQELGRPVPMSWLP